MIKGEKHLTEKEISDQAREKDQRSDFELSSVLNNMWYYNQTYQVVTPEGDKRKPVWYIMDKFGSAIVHNTQPNVKCSPFAFSATGVFYSLLWPIRDLDKGEMCTRNFCPALSGTETNLQREGRLLAFSPSLPESVPTAFVVELSKFPLAAKENNIVINVSSLETPAESQNCLQLKGKKLNLKFFMETNGKEKRPVLRDLGCTLVESMSEAEAIWLEKWNTLGKKVGSEARVNRLAGEEHLLHRQLLSKQVQQVWGNVPWFPVSYDLSQQLPALCADHYTHGIASYWILRASDPSTLSIPPIVTSDLRRVIRCTEMGQLVASPCKYSHVFKYLSLFHEQAQNLPSILSYLHCDEPNNGQASHCFCGSVVEQGRKVRLSISQSNSQFFLGPRTVAKGIKSSFLWSPNSSNSVLIYQALDVVLE